jgi:hypothetical protein
MTMAAELAATLLRIRQNDLFFLKYVNDKQHIFSLDRRNKLWQRMSEEK